MTTKARHKEDKEARREAILDAALQVFGERGYENATMDEVAARVKLAKGTLYRYFASKSDLHVGLAERGVAALRRRLMTLTSDTVGEDRIRTFVTLYAEFAEEEPRLFEAFCFLSGADLNLVEPTEAVARALDQYRATLGHVVALLDEGERAGRLAPPDNALVVASIIAMMTTGFVQLLDRRKNALQLTLGRDRDAMVGLYADLLSRALRA